MKEGDGGKGGGDGREVEGREERGREGDGGLYGGRKHRYV